MASYLVDSSALLDILTADPVWAEWSIRELEKAWAEGTVFIDSIVYSEISIRFSRIEDLEAAVAESGLVWSEVPREALFLAGKAFISYRKAGGGRWNLSVCHPPIRARVALDHRRIACHENRASQEGISWQPRILEPVIPMGILGLHIFLPAEGYVILIMCST